MTREGAETAITGSALVVIGIYTFRRISEPDTATLRKGAVASQLAGVGKPIPLGQFAVGWGFTFLVVSLLAQASPKLGGTFAILVATGAVLGNGQSVLGDVSAKLGDGSASNPAYGGVPPASSTPGGTSPTIVRSGDHVFPVAPTMTH